MIRVSDLLYLSTTLLIVLCMVCCVIMLLPCFEVLSRPRNCAKEDKNRHVQTPLCGTSSNHTIHCAFTFEFLKGSRASSEGIKNRINPRSSQARWLLSKVALPKFIVAVR